MAETEEMAPTPASPSAPQLETPFVVCPYLGRRKHASQFHPFATSSNVCYARSHGAEPYSHVDRHYQMGVCLEAVDGWAGCRGYQAALAKGVAPPRELPPNAGAVVKSRVRRRRRRHGWHYWRQVARQIGTIAAVLAASGLLGWLVARFGK